MHKKLIFAAVLAFAVSSLNAQTPTPASSLEQELAAMSRDHQKAAYQTEEIDEKAQLLDALLVRAVDLQMRHPSSNMAKAWVGWMNMETAAVQTNPQAIMTRFHDARSNLQAAVDADRNCCGAEAHLSLAILYQVPLPGSPANAPELIEKHFAIAFEMQPNGLLPNTRYAGYLMRAGQLEKALKHADAALAAPPLGRPAEDRAIRTLAQNFKDQIQERMKK
jgi:tetratricopeptide (TPR) repeat protein